MSISENERYWQHRANGAEAECERLREALRSAKSEFEKLAVPTDGVRLVDAALATPPPEGEPDTCPECGGLGLVSAVDWVEHHPVLAAEPCPRCSDDAPHTPEQAHGDALAEESIRWLARNASAGHAADASITIEARDRALRGVRQATNASGTRKDGALSALDRLSDRARQAVFAECSAIDEQNPELMWIDRDRSTVISHLTASGVPYVSDNIRNLPEKLDQDEQSLWRQGGKRERQMAEGMRRTIKQLRKALASAPAVPKFPAGWKVNRAEQNRITIQHPKIGFAILTNESDDNPRVTIAYELIDAMIAAAKE